MLTGHTTLELEYPDFVMRFPSPRNWRLVWFRIAAPPPAPAVPIAPVIEIGVSPINSWGFLPPAYPRGVSASTRHFDPSWTRGPVPILTNEGATLPEGTRIYRIAPPSVLSDADLGQMCGAWISAGCPEEAPVDLSEIMSRLPALRMRRGGGKATK